MVIFILFVLAFIGALLAYCGATWCMVFFLPLVAYGVAREIVGGVRRHRAKVR